MVAAFADVRAAIGFSSFGVLLYYAVANASAWTLRPDEGRPVRAIPIIGGLGCLVLAFALPWTSAAAGAAVIAAGALVYRVRRTLDAGDRSDVRGAGSTTLHPSLWSPAPANTPEGEPRWKS